MIEEVKNIINKINNVTKEMVYANRSGVTTVRLIFLKYITDNFLCANSKEDFLEYAKIQKMFAARDVEGGPNNILPILNIVDKGFNLNGVITSSIEGYSAELFGLDNKWTRKDISINTYRSIMEVLSSVDFTDDKQHKLGQMIVEVLLEIFYTISKTSIKSNAEYITNSSLCRLAKLLIDIKPGDSFQDMFGGIGASTHSITGQFNPITYCDINPEVAQTATMLFIMSGKTDFTVNIEDSFNFEKRPIKADKIFIDPPLGFRIHNFNFQTKDSSMAAIQLVESSLNEGGVGVLTVASNVLFKEYQSYNARKEIVDKKHLTAVIALPPCRYGTNINTNVLILSKKNNDNVVFINAATKKISKKDTVILEEEEVQQIVDAYREKKEIIGFSAVVDFEKIINNNYNLAPQQYVKEKIVREKITIEEIDKELDELYNQLKLDL